MQAFLGSLAKILDSLGFLAKKSKNFLGFVSTILKNLANFCEPCQDLGKKCQKSKKFLARKPRRQALGNHPFVKLFLRVFVNFLFSCILGLALHLCSFYPHAVTKLGKKSVLLLVCNNFHNVLVCLVLRVPFLVSVLQVVA